MKNPTYTNLGDLENFLKAKNIKNVFIISGLNSYVKSGAKKIMKKFLLNKKTKFFFKKSALPEINELKRIINSIKDFSPDLIIAIGGGSVIDYAKIANSLELSKNVEQKIINSEYKLKNNFCDIVAIPTTAGSGAEVTSTAVIYLDNKKYSIEGEAIKPKYYFLIPSLLRNLKKTIKASSGFDAISQSVESLLSKRSTKSSIKFAKDSLNLSLKNYINFVKKPSKQNSLNMSYAAMLSGKAINISRTIAPHAVSYPFSSLFGISHGHAVSLTLNKFLKFNFENYSKADCNFNLKLRYNLIFEAFNVKNINELNEAINKIKSQVNLVSDFKKLGINIDKNYGRIIDGTNILRLKNNPIKLDEEDIKQILLKK